MTPTRVVRFGTRLTIGAVVPLLLAGCFSSSDDGQHQVGDSSLRISGFDGNTAAASVSSNTEAADLARASIEGAARAIKSKTLAIPTAALIRNADVEDALTADLLNIIERGSQLNLLPRSAASLVEGDCGGEIDVESDHDGASRPEDGTVGFTYRYADYCTSTNAGRVIINGKGDYTATYRDGNLTRYAIAWNLSHVLKNGDRVTSSLDGTTTCDFTGGTISCGYSEDFRGTGGESYRLEDVSVNRDRNGNFSVTGRVYDPVHGAVNFRASDLNPGNCDKGGFASGSIDLGTESGESLASVSFPGCSEFIVTFGGNADTYPQQSGL